MSIEFKVIIPSAGRANRVTTTKYINNCILCVPESEAAEYEKYNPTTPVVAHPDTILGMGPKRNWIYEKWGNIFMIDDDCYGFSRLYETRGSSPNPEESYDIIQMIGNVAALSGCYLFGISKYVTPLRYSGLKPIVLTGYINSVCIGMVAGSMLKYNENIAITNDAFISLLNAYYYRRCYIDSRYGVKGKGINVGTGGSSLVRRPDSEEKDNIELIKCFGTSVIKFKQRVGTAKKYNLTINLPF